MGGWGNWGGFKAGYDNQGNSGEEDMGSGYKVVWEA